MRQPFAARIDVLDRHPREAALVCADETTRQPDWTRLDAALLDVSAEIRAILARRYSAAMIDVVDEDSAGALRLFAVDMALYRAALSFARQTEAMKERYDNAIKRLEGLAAGRGALTFDASAQTNAGLEGASFQGSPGAPMIDAPERQFTRNKTAGWR